MLRAYLQCHSRFGTGWCQAPQEEGLEEGEGKKLSNFLHGSVRLLIRDAQMTMTQNDSPPKWMGNLENQFHDQNLWYPNPKEIRVLTKFGIQVFWDFTDGTW